MTVWTRLLSWCRQPAAPRHLRLGQLGERAARRHLRTLGLKFLAANVRSAYGEIDLVFRDGECLVFVEVKTRSSDCWARPAAAVDARKQRRVSRAALVYLKRLGYPEINVRFDIVEVLVDDSGVREVRHLPNAFVLSPPFRYG